MAGRAALMSQKPSLLFAALALGLNALVFPGLGSLIARRFREGLAQLSLEALSLAIVVVGAFFFMSFLLPASTMLAIVLLGMSFGFAAWVWGIVTGVMLVVESRKV